MCQHDPHHALFDDGVRHFLHSLLLLRAGSGSGFGSKVLAHVMLWLKFFGHRQPAQTIAFGQILLIYYQFFG